MEIARWIVSATAPDPPLTVYRLSRWQGSLRFYVGRPVTAVEGVDALRQFLDAHHPAQCVMTQRDYDQLTTAGVPLRILCKRDAVVGSEGQGFRRQRWGGVLVVTKADGAAPSLEREQP
jgi:hypothetical protein